MRERRVAGVEHKQGRSGPLVFVRVDHEFADADGVALRETHDIVYRDKPAGPTAVTGPRAPDGHAWRREIRPDPVLLFRYSALTFNGHRIHYDHPYVTGVEGYPGLVVHGPLIATLLLDLLRRERPDAVVARFAFRAVSPLFDTEAFHVCGSPDDGAGTVRLWAAAPDGRLAMEASAELARSG
jgi:3-methylfumaryl-CoA hydratase